MNEEDKEYQRELYEALRYANQQFDKNVLFIASGALGISFAFIEKILGDLYQAICKGFLFASWYIFALVILLSLISHFRSAKSIMWTIENFFDEDCEKEVAKKNKVIGILNKAQIVGLVAGIVSFVIFLNINLNIKTMANQGKEEKPYVKQGNKVEARPKLSPRNLGMEVPPRSTNKPKVIQKPTNTNDKKDE